MSDERGVLWRIRRLAEHLRVIWAAAAISRNPWAALNWYQSEPLSVFDEKTAKRLVSDGRVEAVLTYLGSIGTGPAG